MIPSLPATARPLPSRPASQSELVLRQVEAIDAWHASRRAVEQAERATPPSSREQQLDRARRADVVRRQHATVVERAEQHLRDSARLLRTDVPLRAVVAHRDPWFAGRLCEGLAAEGVQVLCCLDNGADAVGATVVEQPDLLVVEDRLPMVGGAAVLREVLPLAVGTLAVGQASGEAPAAELLAAGARLVELRRVSPDQVVARARALFD